MEFYEGQRVHVEFDGTICNRTGDWQVIDADDGYLHQFWPTDLEQIVKPLSPANWPPRVGDIWEANGNEYYVREHSCRDDFVINAFGYEVDPDSYYSSQLADFKALNPTLIRRREGV